MMILRLKTQPPCRELSDTENHVRIKELNPNSPAFKICLLTAAEHPATAAQMPVSSFALGIYSIQGSCVGPDPVSYRAQRPSAPLRSTGKGCTLRPQKTVGKFLLPGEAPSRPCPFVFSPLVLAASRQPAEAREPGRSGTTESPRSWRRIDPCYRLRGRDCSRHQPLF